MIFTSLSFFIFLATVFILYWKLSHRYQNILLLVASYVFYAWWDYRFLLLIALYSIADFYLGKHIAKTEGKRKRFRLLIVSILMSLLILGFFKYFGFFVGSLSAFLVSLGLPTISLGTLSIILPLGLSFYIFKSMSYTIDVYRGRMKPGSSVIEYMVYLAFFPQLAAGPIERASDMLPQFSAPRAFLYDRAVDGVRQILWGLFKKIVIADSLAIVIAKPFLNPEAYSGGELMLALFYFAIQLYADFSGYSDMAIGTSKLLGFESKANFSYPYFARSIAEFWRRWHISLSTWLRDYLYYPIIMSSHRKTKTTIYFATFVTFVLVGLWHGTGWNFVAMGVIFGVYIIAESLLRDLKKKI